jgi:hypothetical protein
MTYDIQLAPGTFLTKKLISRVTIAGIDFDEKFLSELSSVRLNRLALQRKPILAWPSGLFYLAPI